MWGIESPALVRIYYLIEVISIKGLIVAGGKFLNREILRDIIKETELIIAADGAGKYLYDIDVTPDYLVGDFDTLDSFYLDHYKDKGVKIHTFPRKKDKTDLELAIDYAIKEGVKELILIGVLGTRMDHSLGNIMLLFMLWEKGIKGRIIDDNNEMFIVEKETIITKNRFSYVSILSIYEDMIGVTLRGFKYETTNEIFYRTSTFGISNELINEKGIVKIKSGKGLIILSKD